MAGASCRADLLGPPPDSSARSQLGLGCMRLSTERDRDEAGAVAVLQAAFDAGVTLLDTADAYAWDDSERGHNERLIARALATWTGDRSLIQIATKGGFRRPDGRWEPDGRAKQLIDACRQSCTALGVERIDLYQLHVPDPRTPLETSVRALAALKRDGLIRQIGLCNVTVGQIEQARRLTDIDAIQIELSIWNDHHFLSGVASQCVATASGCSRIVRSAGQPVVPKRGRIGHSRPSGGGTTRARSRLRSPG